MHMSTTKIRYFWTIDSTDKNPYNWLKIFLPNHIKLMQSLISVKLGCNSNKPNEVTSEFDLENYTF